MPPSGSSHLHGHTAVLELVRAGQQGRDNCLALTASSRIRMAFGVYQKGNELVASDWHLHSSYSVWIIRLHHVVSNRQFLALLSQFDPWILPTEDFVPRASTAESLYQPHCFVAYRLNFILGYRR